MPITQFSNRFGGAIVNVPQLVRADIRARERIVKVMADDMRLAETRRGSVDAEDLELLGWLPQQINECSADARRRAIALSLRCAA